MVVSGAVARRTRSGRHGAQETSCCRGVLLEMIEMKGNSFSQIPMAVWVVGQSEIDWPPSPMHFM